MSQSLLDRLRKALAGQYEVERELAAGGMGSIFVARDVTLERPVAIKILRPELATARAAERFLREARMLARLSHPNVVPVHSAGEADGIFYYVMDYVKGETLAARLERGVLSRDEAVKLGTDLLAALEAAHAHGIVHRDVKPANIFLVADRALLGDFGIARPLDESPLTAAGDRIGTPSYMAPEQLEGEATPRTDLYAVGMVLYEALTGRHWSVLTPRAEADWSGVPRQLALVLRRALAWSPDNRWEDAVAFQRALTRRAAPATRGRSLFQPAVAAVLLAAIAWGVYRIVKPAAAPLPPAAEAVRDLVLFPVEIVGRWEAAIDGADLARLVVRQLGRAPGVSLVPTQHAFFWWDSASSERPSRTPPERGAAEALRARYAAHATLYVLDGSRHLELDVFDSEGEPVPGPRRIEVRGDDIRELSDSLTLRLLSVVLGDRLPELARLTPDVQALIPFLHGERAFERGAWVNAVSFYEQAVARDSGFVLAWWHLANAWRSLGRPGPYPKDFRRLHEQYGAELGSVDSLLMAAQLAPAGEARLRLYRQARRLDPLDYFAAYLYGEDLFNRGPLWGIPLDSAVSALQEAVALNPYWALAYVHLIWADIRLGRAVEARGLLDRLPEIAAAPEEGWLYPPELLELAYSERFRPGAAAEAREAVLAQPTFGSFEWLPVLARFAGAFDLPETQVAFGRALVEGAAAVRGLCASGHEALGLGLVALGRSDAALVHFDSAATLFGTPEASLQAAEWRVLPNALGLPGTDPAELSRGRERVEALVDDDELGDRAAWALAMDAYARGDTSAAWRWTQYVRRAVGAVGAGRLADFLQAMQEAQRGRYRAALDLSRPLFAFQARTVQLHGAASAGEGLGDPFARAALHLKRAGWHAELGEWEAAEREWLWYEAVDLPGFPGIGLSQEGEIDWALGNYGRYRRGESELRRGEHEAACSHLGRFVELWSEGEPGFRALAEEAKNEMEQVCG
jgi:hypothetical protein